MPNKAPIHKPGRGVPPVTASTAAQALARQIRSGSRWAKLRKFMLARGPLCPGLWHGPLPRLAEDVHHIQPLVKRPDLAYTLDNLIPLCRQCHTWVEGRGEGIAGVVSALKKQGSVEKSGSAVRDAGGAGLDAGEGHGGSDTRATPESTASTTQRPTNGPRR